MRNLLGSSMSAVVLVAGAVWASPAGPVTAAALVNALPGLPTKASDIKECTANKDTQTKMVNAMTEASMAAAKPAGPSIVSDGQGQALKAADDKTYQECPNKVLAQTYEQRFAAVLKKLEDDLTAVAQAKTAQDTAWCKAHEGKKEVAEGCVGDPASGKRAQDGMYKAADTFLQGAVNPYSQLKTEATGCLAVREGVITKIAKANVPGMSAQLVASGLSMNWMVAGAVSGANESVCAKAKEVAEQAANTH